MWIDDDELSGDELSSGHSVYFPPLFADKPGVRLQEHQAHHQPRQPKRSMTEPMPSLAPAAPTYTPPRPPARGHSQQSSVANPAPPVSPGDEYRSSYHTSKLSGSLYRARHKASLRSESTASSMQRRMTTEEKMSEIDEFLDGAQVAEKGKGAEMENGLERAEKVETGRKSHFKDLRTEIDRLLDRIDPRGDRTDK